MCTWRDKHRKHSHIYIYRMIAYLDCCHCLGCSCKHINGSKRMQQQLVGRLHKPAAEPCCSCMYISTWPASEQTLLMSIALPISLSHPSKAGRPPGLVLRAVSSNVGDMIIRMSWQELHAWCSALLVMKVLQPYLQDQTSSLPS